jgi:hypothetical protein
MGITADFLIKHVRPYGEDAFERMCGPTGAGSLRAWLVQRGVPPRDINIAFAGWMMTANLPVDSETEPQFVASATISSEARWSELRPTGRSTIVFLNGPLLAELAERCRRNPGRSINFDPAEYIPIAVTINQTPNAPPEVTLNAEGMRVGVDPQGDCVHFDSLIT